MVTNENRKISEIDILPEKERKMILYDFNDTAAHYPKNKTIHQLFEEQAERTPENIALVFEEQKLTYRELNVKSNRLAKMLREKGVKPNMIVGVMAERSMEMIIGIIAVLKSGEHTCRSIRNIRKTGSSTCWRTAGFTSC